VANQPAAAEQPAPDVADISRTLAQLPQHLGWGSELLTAVLRPHHPPPPHNTDTPITPPPPPTPKQPAADSWVKLYPDIGLMMLRRELTAPGRLWLTLHHLDAVGQGMVPIAVAQQRLTGKSSPLRLCGRRQFRNLLRDGEGIYWTRENDRLWLRSAARVAAALGGRRLTGQPVALPVSALLNGVGVFRAHLYAAFHSSRAKEPFAPSDDGRHLPAAGRYNVNRPPGSPISREALAALSGVGQSSQRTYEARLRLPVQANYAVGELVTKERLEERAWQQGGALFKLNDHTGQQGEQEKSYLAWQLPNSYSGQHQQRPKGRQKRINRQLKDLVMKGMPGNIEDAGEAQRPEKRYFPNARLAVERPRQQKENRRYWRRPGKSAIWYVLEGGV
jgi:hypothetical protein